MRLLFLILLGLFTSSSFSAPTASQNTAVILPIKGGIGPATADFIQRGFQKAKQQGAKIIILQIDTPGGLSQSMREIIQTMLTASVPVIAYVAPSGARAASAGTYILYAAQIAAMAKGTNLGAATPVALGMPTDADKNKKQNKSAHERKALNDARAYIRGLAELRHRNVQWAEKAVVSAESLSAEEALKMRVINLIANDIPDLLNKINGMSVEVQGKLHKIVSHDLVLQLIKPDWRSRFLAVITDPSIAYILLMVGVYGIFFEFMSPGFVAPGVIGAICLLLGLYALALLPINYAGLALLLLGIAFMVAEAFLPSFGALGIGGVISFVVGSILLLKVGSGSFSLPIYTIVIVTIVTIAFLFFVLNMALRSRRKPVVSGCEQLIGKQGLVQVDKDGRMWVVVEGERWQCKSSQTLVTGERVNVLNLDGLTLTVGKSKQE